MTENILKLHDAAMFINDELPHRKDIIEGGILPQNSIAIIGGISKMGKSILALNLGIQIARGKPFLGFNVPEPKRVIYLQAEISPHSMQDRLRKMLFSIDCDLIPERLFICGFRGLKLDRNADIERVSKLVENYRAGVLLVDPLYKYHAGDENKVSDMSRFFDRIDWLVQRNNCSVVICHHFGKPQQDGRDGSTLFRGSSTITDYADSYLMLQRKSKESRLHVKLSFNLRNAVEPEPMILYRNPETLWYEVHEQDSSDKVTAFDVAKALEALGGFTSRQADLIEAVKQATEASEKTIRLAIKEAADQGLILTHGSNGKAKSICLPGIVKGEKPW